MSRTQKKCLIASGALHLLLLLVLIITPAFLIKKEEPVDQTVLTLVNTDVAESAPAATATATATAEPVPPPVTTQTPVPSQPRQEPPPRPTPRPPVREEPKKPEPKPPVEVKEPTPTPTPVPVKIPDPKPTPQPVEKPKPTVTPIKVNLNPVRDTSPAPRPKNNTAQEIAKALESSTIDFSGTTTSFKPIPGVKGGVTYDNYGSVVKSVYMRNWNPPSDIAPRHSTVSVEVVILKSGRIKSASIIKKSGSTKLDANINSLINTIVKEIGQPFPAGARESERTYIIDFNLNLKFNA